MTGFQHCPPTNQQFLGIQILRFIAAMLVVAMHTTQAISIYITGKGAHSYWAAGSIGVDIFFVISGFVMTLAVGRSAGTLNDRRKNSWIFLKRRLLRIIPLYWFYTLAKVVLLLLLPVLASRSSIDPTHLVYSLVFIPTMSPWGLIEPILPVGWTLNFEMFFYLVFTFAILFGESRIRFCLLVFTLLFATAQYLNFIALQFYVQSIIFEFILGICVARAFLYRKIMSPALGLLIALTAIYCMFSLTSEISLNRLIRWGFPAAFLVAGIVWIEPWIAKLKAARPLSFLGDTSYSLYLSHTFAVPAGVLAARGLGFQSPALIFLLVMILAILTGCLSYLFFEKPMNRFFKKVFLQNDQVVSIAGQASHAK